MMIKFLKDVILKLEFNTNTENYLRLVSSLSYMDLSWMKDRDGSIQEKNWMKSIHQ